MSCNSNFVMPSLLTLNAEISTPLRLSTNYQNLEQSVSSEEKRTATEELISTLSSISEPNSALAIRRLSMWEDAIRMSLLLKVDQVKDTTTLSKMATLSLEDSNDLVEHELRRVEYRGRMRWRREAWMSFLNLVYAWMQDRHSGCGPTCTRTPNGGTGRREGHMCTHVKWKFIQEGCRNSMDGWGAICEVNPWEVSAGRAYGPLSDLWLVLWCSCGDRRRPQPPHPYGAPGGALGRLRIFVVIC